MPVRRFKTMLTSQYKQYGIVSGKSTLFSSASGGVITESGGYRIHTFGTVGNSSFVINSGQFNVEYLVIAGGGGGGSSGANYCGGGGAGGYRSSVIGQLTGGGGNAESTLPVITQSYSVTVGDGGGGNTNGGDSVFGSIISTGGGAGRGNAYASQGFTGGSGGGATPINATGGSRTSSPVQGNIGGNSSSSNQGGQDSGAGGGGGAGGAGNHQGSFPFINSAGVGGVGLTSSITGSSVIRAAGGTGSAYYPGEQASGIGGGTNGVTNFSPNPASRVGTQNTGSGGGGGRSDSGQSGGSGIVVIRYPIITISYD